MNPSSLIRANPKLELPESATYLNASRRSKLLSNVWIKLADTQPEGTLGKLELVTVHSRKYAELADVSKKRLYE